MLALMPDCTALAIRLANAPAGAAAVVGVVVAVAVTGTAGAEDPGGEDIEGGRRVLTNVND